MTCFKPLSLEQTVLCSKGQLIQSSGGLGSAPSFLIVSEIHGNVLNKPLTNHTARMPVPLSNGLSTRVLLRIIWSF